MRRSSASGWSTDRGVLARLDHFVEIADAAFPHGAGERAVAPVGALVGNQVAANEVGGVRSSWQATVYSGSFRRAAMWTTSGSCRNRSAP